MQVLNKNCSVCNRGYHVAPSQEKYRGISKFCSKPCKGDSMSQSQRGVNNPSWRGGVSTEYHRLRASKEFRNWREAVFFRDDYTCMDCGARNGNGKRVVLHSHHIKPFAYFPELRFDISNGLTLCVDCHKKTDTYGSKAKRMK